MRGGFEGEEFTFLGGCLHFVEGEEREEGGTLKDTHAYRPDFVPVGLQLDRTSTAFLGNTLRDSLSYLQFRRFLG